MSKYRLDESFEIIGGFWIFGQEDKKFTGTLSSRKGLVEIQTSPTYAELDDAALRASMLELSGTTDIQQINAICGFTTDKRCTLLNSVILDGGGLTDFSSRRQVQRKLYRAMRTVMGLHLESSEAMSIDGAACYFTKIHHLLPVPWSSQMADRSTTHIVPWKAKEIFRFTSDELRAEVACEVFAGGSAKARKAVSIKSVPLVKITSQSPQSVDWFTSLAFRLENFFTLFLGTSVGLKHVQLFQSDDDGWVVQKMRRRKEKVNFQTWVRCPFPNVADALIRWLAVPPDRQLVELNMLGMVRKSDVFSETEFLTLAQTLEGFGRIRFGGKRPRQAKVDQLIQQTYDLISPDLAHKLVGDRSGFIRKVIQTRDYYTHLGNPKGTAAAKSTKELFLLNKRLHAFLRCVMLLDLGISEEHLREPILYQATRWR
jgi:hypothetical protein